MGYPKQMYKGTYTKDAVNGEEKVVADDAEEKAARKKGFVDGHEFFSKPAEGEVAELKEPAKPPVPAAPPAK